MLARGSPRPPSGTDKNAPLQKTCGMPFIPVIAALSGVMPVKKHGF
jgi:hypothetical protein